MRPRIIKHYELLRRLGSGGGGIVYYANDTMLARPVVIKMLRRGAPSRNQSRENILREARLASALDHPNVCAIYEVDEVDGQAFIVMQYVPGRTLSELIRTGPLNLQLGLSIGIQISDGLAEAHRLGILHRDLKPGNIMITDGGLVKILDFGLAKRQTDADVFLSAGGRRAKGSITSARRGTIAYMAPELFVTGRSSEQSDIFSFGLVLYEIFTGAHPFMQRIDQLAFAQPGAGDDQIARAIQYFDPPPPREKRPDLPAELEGVILKAIEKQPSNRFPSVAEIREALRTVVKSRHLDSGFVTSDLPPAPTAGAGDQDRRTGFLALLAERFMGGASADVPPNSVAVLPFTSLESSDDTPFYGAALADAIAARLAHASSMVVRPSTLFASAPANSVLDPVEAGKRLMAAHVLTGSFFRSEKNFVLNWQLLDVERHAIRSGGTIMVASFDLIAIQNEIASEVLNAVHAAGRMQPGAGVPRRDSLAPDLSEQYLQARSLLSKFLFSSSQRDDLDQARGRFRAVLARAPDFAPAHAGLGVTHLEYVQRGFGTLANLIDAQICFERALELDAGLVEARLYRVYTQLARGDKDGARHSVHHLLETAPGSFSVHIVAAVLLRLDGLYESAMSQLSAALKLNPAGATMVYNHRARIYHYQGQLELALEEINKGLMLEPRHSLLRTTLGYLYLRRTQSRMAIETLRAVLADDPDLRMAYPTLAMCYDATGEPESADSLITEEVVASAEADCEMAYRLATFFAARGSAAEALRWLRRSIYLGEGNYPWLARNPAWKKLRGHEDFMRIMADLKKSYQANRRRWSHLLSNTDGRESGDGASRHE